MDYDFGVALRRLEEDDLPVIFDMRNDARVWRWCRQNAPLHWLKHEDWFEWQAKEKSVSMFAVQSSTLVGVCGLTDIDLTNRRAEFSLYIDPERQGEGYGKAALRSLLKHGFYDLGLNRIWGETFDSNHAYDIFLRMGFEYEGKRREFYYRNGKFIDCYLVSISREQFDATMANLPII